jgi:hypothetical protein
MAQQGTSGTPPERRYDETLDPRNPPRAVVNPRVRSKALLVYLGGIVLLFAVVALTFLAWPGIDRDVARIDTVEPPVGTTGEPLPGGFQPGSRPGSTADELEHRGVGASIRPEMPHLVAPPVITRLRDITGTSPAELSGRRVELQDVEVESRAGDTLWLRSDSERVAVRVPAEVRAEPGTRVDIGGVIEPAADGTVVVRASRVDVRE